MPLLDFIAPLHQRTRRDYLERVVGADKAECAAVAKRFERDYWDGDRKHGYGGYYYDSRWFPIAQALARHYQLRPGQRVLDVGCGKGFLLHELARAVPGLEVAGIDISRYALEAAKEEVRPFLQLGSATELPFPTQSFDLVLAINVLHNLYVFDLCRALRELERVGRHKYLVVDSYRSEREKANLLYWQLTCECFFTPPEWEWLFRQTGYMGDHSFVFFE